MKKGFIPFFLLALAVTFAVKGVLSFNSTETLTLNLGPIRNALANIHSYNYRPDSSNERSALEEKWNHYSEMVGTETSRAIVLVDKPLKAKRFFKTNIHFMSNQRLAELGIDKMAYLAAATIYPVKRAIEVKLEPSIKIVSVKRKKVINYVLASKSNKSDELSGDGINHFGYKVYQDVELTNWSKEIPVRRPIEMITAKINKSEYSKKESTFLEDSIDHALAGQNKIGPKVFTINKVNKLKDPKNIYANQTIPDDLLKMIDEQTEVLNDQGISNNAQNVLVQKNLMAFNQSSQNVNTQVMPPIMHALPGIDHQTQKMLNVLAKSKKASNYNEGDKVSIIYLKTFAAAIDGKSGASVSNFEFIPSYNINDRFYDEAEGEIVLTEKLNSSHSVLRGTLIQSGRIPTVVDIVLEEGEYDLEIPFLSEESLRKFTSAEGISDDGGHLLVDINDKVDSIDINSKHAGRLFLNGNFKVVTSTEDYRYILFLGIEPGNTVLSYLTTDSKNTEKIVHITDGTVYFEASIFSSEKLESFSLYERNLLSRDKTDLILDEKDIKLMSFEKIATQVSNNRYEIRFPLLPVGTRRYFEFTHLEQPLYVGNWKEQNIVLPSREFIGHVLSKHNLDDLRGICMIQFNLDKEINQIKAEGETDQGPMSLAVTYLDRDGSIGEEATEMATQAFFVGEALSSGVINARVEYADGSSDHIQTYCAPSTYLLEQL